MKKAILMAAVATFIAAPAMANDPAKLDEKFSKMDTDGNGSISQSEYTTAKADKFEDADTNGDGMLSKEELKAHWDKKKQDKRG